MLSRGNEHSASFLPELGKNIFRLDHPQFGRAFWIAPLTSMKSRLLKAY